MKFTVALQTSVPNPQPEFYRAEAIARVAQAAERAGFAAVSVTDHPVPEDTWLATGGHHALDPFVALSFAAAATTTLRLLTQIYILPVRNPFLSAKAAASLDAISDGRLIFGIAAGYLEPEFRALGVDFAERNELTDEAIRAMKVAWTQDHFDFVGRHFAAHGHTVLPKPVQKPHPPLWVGGNSKRAIRRAVELCDGWIPIINFSQHVERRKTPAIEGLADLQARLDYARAHAEKVGRTAPLDVSFTFGDPTFGTPDFSRDRLLGQIDSLARLGVTYLNTHREGRIVAEQSEKIEQFGEEVLRYL